MERILNIISTHDFPTRNHQRRVSDLAVNISQQMGLSSEQTEFIKIIGSLHDIGKVIFPQEFMVKTTGLSPSERTLVVTHPKVGFDMLNSLGFPETIKMSVLQHHEHLDGSGYPNGLKGDKIRIEAKVVTVADVVDAMTSNRPYNMSLGVGDAVGEITKYSGRYYEPQAVEACLEILKIQQQLPTNGYSEMLLCNPMELILPW
jgi:putative nucleotidyltransferase with HDIG domain